jgi:hypothetical protein
MLIIALNGEKFKNDALALAKVSYSKAPVDAIA